MFPRMHAHVQTRAARVRHVSINTIISVSFKFLCDIVWRRQHHEQFDVPRTAGKPRGRPALVSFRRVMMMQTC
jgi:hypothetical protein